MKRLATTATAATTAATTAVYHYSATEMSNSCCCCCSCSCCYYIHPFQHLSIATGSSCYKQLISAPLAAVLVQPL
eukprot:11439-Heterococcus_DN1.PRE.1